MHGRERSRSRDPSILVSGHVIELQAPQAPPSFYLQPCEVPQYRVECLLGKGSFGAVWKATIGDRVVSIKSIRLRDGYREVQALRVLRGSPNIVVLLGVFQAANGSDGEYSLNLVMEYVPDTLQRIIKHTRYGGQVTDMMLVRLYSYQLLRGVGALVRHKIVHRDLKPANLLVDPHTRRLAICDFGTAKFPDEDSGNNQPYLCSRFYRAPELILSVSETRLQVDIWSVGCIVVELIRGYVLFQGTDGVNQLSHIIEICGTPTAAELYAMNPMYDAAVGFGPKLEQVPWSDVLGTRSPPAALTLVGGLLKYDPSKRPLPFEAMAADFFTDLRMDARNQDPSLFTFLPEELEQQHRSIRQRLYVKGISQHARRVVS